MGMTITPIPFWSMEIEVNEVIEASDLSLFFTGKLSDLGYDRLAYSSLHDCDDGTFLLELRGGEFIKFV